MSIKRLANVPENWVFNTAGYRPWELKKILEALPADTKRLTPSEMLFIPHKGREKTLRIILPRLFRRIRSGEARNILETKSG